MTTNFSIFQCKDTVPSSEPEHQLRQHVAQNCVSFTSVESRDARLPGERNNPSLNVRNLPPPNRGKHY